MIELFPKTDPKPSRNSRAKRDRENQRLMREARERKRLADRTPEEVVADEERERREWEGKILDGLEGEDRHRRETLLMHRRGEYRLTATQRAYQRRKKTNYRRRVRERRAAEAAAAKQQEEAARRAERERVLALVKAQLARRPAAS